MTGSDSTLFDLSDVTGGDGTTPTGWRLQRFEVLNWGTFDSVVWSFEAGGRNALLTGDIGSGKSTLVDALTTLLLPANVIDYNKAAGAERRERDLRSYVLGHHRLERNEETGTTRAVALRDTSSYSVLLATFANALDGAWVSLAQVFRARDLTSGQPDRFYVIADTALSIAEDFVDFGEEIVGLRRRLKAAGALVFDTFPDYGREYRRRLGIPSAQALTLFHRTVSMKAVDNLNDFVRRYMLEPFDTAQRIEALIAHYDDLTRAHDAVVRARLQLEILTPLVELLDGTDALGSEIGALDAAHGALRYYFAETTAELLRRRIGELDRHIEATEAELTAADSELSSLREREAGLALRMAGAGGDRLAQIERELARARSDETERRRRHSAFSRLLETAGLDPVGTAEQFRAVTAAADARRGELDERWAGLDTLIADARHELRGIDEQSAELNAELQSLRSRRTNLPAASLRIRSDVCADLDIDEDELAFAGELIDVREDAPQWRGAAERVLRGFALSLLVPEEHYPAVARWIDRHHLGARLVYFRVPASVPAPGSPQRTDSTLLLLDVLIVREDTPFDAWLTTELRRRADHSCVGSTDEFDSHRRAVTMKGQIKDRSRHEKDDRRRIDDPASYLLGWSNEAKIEALVDRGARLHDAAGKLRAQVADLDADRRSTDEARARLVALEQYQSWEDLDWQASVREISRLGEEQASIRSASGELRELAGQLDALRAEIASADTLRDELLGTRATSADHRASAQRELEHRSTLLSDTEVVEEARVHYPAIEEALAELGRSNDDPTTAGEVEAELRDHLAQKRTGLADKREDLARRAVRLMAAFRSAYPAEVDELDDSLDSGPEYRELEARIATDDLPRFEAEFKESLNENTIREIATLSAQLEAQEQDIRERVGVINDSLADIDYSEGRYIHLVPQRTPNVEVRQFRSDLRACTDNVLGDETGAYSEERFAQVRALVERFKGREGHVDADRRWTQRVTDVRQWFVFSASERWRSDDSEFEHYADTGGKSGGQKEKLAYTVLAASLAYQYRLGGPDQGSRSFRFVVIDEAFGRGSDDSSRYALNLFDRLGLQLLIVTPLQKIHVIEPHVSAVGFVDNPTGSHSRLKYLTIEQYRAQRRTALAGRGRAGAAGAGSAAARR